MKLKTFNSTNVVVQRTSIPFIFMNAKAGLIAFNGKVVDDIGLTDKTQIQFHQDEADEQVWYLELVKKDGFNLRINTSKGAKGLFLSNTTIVRKIFDSMAYTENSGRITIGEKIIFEKRTLYTLITAALRNK